MFDINDYYLGVIVPTIPYYLNIKRHRYFLGESFDPFYGMSPQVALIQGQATLLQRVGDDYYDEYFSIYRHELRYHLNKTNSLGIMLAYARPFQSYYEEDALIYSQEDLDSSYQKMDEVFNRHSYYVSYSAYNKQYAIIQLDMEPMKLVTADYLREQLENSGFSYQKTE